MLKRPMDVMTSCKPDLALFKSPVSCQPLVCKIFVPLRRRLGVTVVKKCFSFFNFRKRLVRYGAVAALHILAIDSKLNGNV